MFTPDGTTVFFCHTGDEHDDWLTDFEPTREQAGDLLTATDHVSLTEPFDDFDQSTTSARCPASGSTSPTSATPRPGSPARSKA